MGSIKTNQAIRELRNTQKSEALLSRNLSLSITEPTIDDVQKQGNNNQRNDNDKKNPLKNLCLQFISLFTKNDSTLTF